MTLETSFFKAVYVVMSSGFRSASTARAGSRAKKNEAAPAKGSKYVPANAGGARWGTIGASHCLPPAHLRMGWHPGFRVEYLIRIRRPGPQSRTTMCFLTMWTAVPSAIAFCMYNGVCPDISPPASGTIKGYHLLSGNVKFHIGHYRYSSLIDTPCVSMLSLW